jgi:hypothetical protein
MHAAVSTKCQQRGEECDGSFGAAKDAYQLRAVHRGFTWRTSGFLSDPHSLQSLRQLSASDSTDIAKWWLD